MKLSELAEILPSGGKPAADTVISGLSSDSRIVAAGDLFFALAGSRTDGTAFAADAAARGAAAIVVRQGALKDDPGVPVLEVEDPRRALALAAARFSGRQPETMVAVTGTSGKTSVASFTRQIWEH